MFFLRRDVRGMPNEALAAKNAEKNELCWQKTPFSGLSFSNVINRDQ